MIRVLMIVKAMEKTGVTNVMLSYFDNMDKKNMQIDFVTGTLYEGEYKKHVEEAGGKFIVISNRDKNLLKYINSLTKLMKKNKYHIVHVHGNSTMIFPELMAAKMAGIPVRIAHSHNTMCNHPRLQNIARPIFNRCYTDAVACSEDAGKWMFGDKTFTVINNGVDTEKYKFAQDTRELMRSELKIENDETVIGHVGYFNYQKNQERLIKIFAALHKKIPGTKLLLVGDGANRSRMEELTVKMRLGNSVIFYGNSDNVEQLMSAMDVFVLPSHFEGFGIVLLEAQASGMKCVASDVVPRIVGAATHAIQYISLDTSNKVWCHNIIQAARENRSSRKENSEKFGNLLAENNFDTKIIAHSMEMYYRKALKQKGIR